MSLHLPEYSRDTFARRLRASAPSPLTDPAIDALFAHYQELQRWAPIISLVGPGAGPEILQRHYGEALHALDWLDPRAKTLVDVGSGAGFPGFVLAAARPALEVTLVEPRERRWSFLSQAARRASLKVRCLNVRVASPLPAGLPERIDIVTLRALRPEAILPSLAERLAPEAQVLLWVGEEDPLLPKGFARGRVLQFAGSNVRRLLELVPLTEK
jgi:16S rRNA (guanine527-N7)-methyltransferase